MEKLAIKVETFCQEFIKDLNGTQAAIRAGYSKKTARVQAAKMLSKANIQARIQELADKRAEKSGIDSARVLQEIARLAFVDVSQAGNYKIKCPADIQQLPEDLRRAIIGWTWDKNGRFVIKFADKVKGLELYGRHLKLFTDKHEHGGPNGGPMQHDNVIIELQGDALIEELKRRGLPTEPFER